MFSKRKNEKKESRNQVTSGGGVLVSPRGWERMSPHYVYAAYGGVLSLLF
ncbi:MAG TPA: hypothetical protein VF842_05995 [Flavobacterium sp.]